MFRRRHHQSTIVCPIRRVRAIGTLYPLNKIRTDNTKGEFKTINEFAREIIWDRKSTPKQVIEIFTIELFQSIYSLLLRVPPGRLVPSLHYSLWRRRGARSDRKKPFVRQRRQCHSSWRREIGWKTEKESKGNVADVMRLYLSC